MRLRSLHLSLIAVQAVAALTLLRSVAYDRWITVLASALLLLGATVAQRGGRTWSIALMFSMAAAFTTAFWIGIAPAWFVLVGVAGALPLALTWRALKRFDRGAALAMAGLAASAGALGAMTWKQIAWPVFWTFDALRPSVEAQHGPLVAALAALGLVVAGASALRRRRHDVATEPVTGMRIAVDPVAHDAAAELEAEAELDELPARKRLRTGT